MTYISIIQRLGFYIIIIIIVNYYDLVVRARVCFYIIRSCGLLFDENGGYVDHGKLHVSVNLFGHTRVGTKLPGESIPLLRRHTLQENMYTVFFSVASVFLIPLFAFSFFFLPFL